MIDDVDITLARWRSTPFVWGDADCMLSIGDYIALRGGLDVTGDFRGSYDTEVGALARMASCGGPAGLVDSTGLERTDEPQRGDVVVFDPGQTGDGIGALCTGRGIAARLPRGVIEIDRRFVTILHAWKVAP